MYPEELDETPDAQMLLQLGSDDELCDDLNWAGDGGDFVVYAEPEGDGFRSVSVHIQGG